MGKVLAFMITRADTPMRRELLKKTIDSALETAGIEFDLRIHYWNDPGLIGFEGAGVNVGWMHHPHNVGQHVIMNTALRRAKEKGYEYLLRLDDDCQFKTKRWLKKMVDAAELLGPAFVISPTVQGLKFPPERTNIVDINGVDVRFLTEAIGGVCRLHNVASLTDEAYPYISDIRHPLGFGDATGIAKWCTEAPEDNKKWMVYLTKVKVKHSTLLQEKGDEVYHEQHAMFQALPYIPPIV